MNDDEESIRVVDRMDRRRSALSVQILRAEPRDFCGPTHARYQSPKSSNPDPRQSHHAGLTFYLLSSLSSPFLAQHRRATTTKKQRQRQKCSPPMVVWASQRVDQEVSGGDCLLVLVEYVLMIAVLMTCIDFMVCFCLACGFG